MHTTDLKASPEPSHCPAIPACQQQRTTTIKYVDGSSKKINLSQHFKAQYFDEYTNDVLPKEHLESAMQDELDYFNDSVRKVLPLKDAIADVGSKLVGTRWVL